MLFYLKAANSDVHLTAALVWTVEHLEHPICFDDGTSPVSLRPDAAKTHAVDLTRGQQEGQISAVHLDLTSFSLCLNGTQVHHAMYVCSPAQTPLQLSVTSQL